MLPLSSGPLLMILNKKLPTGGIGDITTKITCNKQKLTFKKKKKISIKKRQSCEEEYLRKDDFGSFKK